MTPAYDADCTPVVPARMVLLVPFCQKQEPADGYFGMRVHDQFTPASEEDLEYGRPLAEAEVVSTILGMPGKSFRAYIRNDAGKARVYLESNRDPHIVYDEEGYRVVPFGHVWVSHSGNGTAGQFVRLERSNLENGSFMTPDEYAQLVASRRD